MRLMRLFVQKNDMKKCVEFFYCSDFLLLRNIPHKRQEDDVKS